MKQCRYLLAGLLAVAIIDGRLLAELPASAAEDSPQLQQLKAGTVVAIYSKERNKYLCLEKTSADTGNPNEYKYLKATGTDKTDPRCQFQIVRMSNDPNWLAIKTLQNRGKNLQCNVSDPSMRVCRFENWNFGAWEQWALITADANDLDGVRLKNRATETFLSVVPGNLFDGRVAGNYALNRPSGDGTWERLKIEIIDPVGDEDRAGGSAFTFRRAMRDANGFAFSDKWTFKSAKSGAVKLKIKAPLDAYIVFSPAANFANNQAYWIAIGAHANTRSIIHNGGTEIDRRWLYENDPAKKGGDQGDMLTGGWGFDGDKLHAWRIKDSDRDFEKTGSYQGTAWEDYWATYEVADGKVTIAWGKGTILGKNEHQRVTHANSVVDGLGYLGLGGWYLDVEFKDIQIDPEATIEEQTISDIAGIEKIEGVAHRIALGATTKGKYLAMMIDSADRKLSKMSGATMGGWEAVEVKDGSVAPAKFEDVAVAADGTAGVLADDGSLFVSYDGGDTWKNLGAPKGADDRPIDMDRVAIASKDLIAILDKESSDVFIYSNGAWKRIAHGQAMSIAAGYPHTLLAVNKNLDCYQLEDGEWVEFDNPNKIGRFAIIDKDTMYGTKEQDGRYYLHKFDKGAWAPVMDAAGKPVEGIKEAVANQGGALLLMNIRGEVLKKGTLDIPVRGPAEAAAKAAAEAAAAAAADKAAKEAAEAAVKAAKAAEEAKDAASKTEAETAAKAAKEAADKAKDQAKHVKDKKVKKDKKEKKKDKKKLKKGVAKMIDADGDGKPDAEKQDHKEGKKAKKDKKGKGKKDKHADGAMIDADGDGKSDAEERDHKKGKKDKKGKGKKGKGKKDKHADGAMIDADGDGKPDAVASGHKGEKKGKDKKRKRVTDADGDGKQDVVDADHDGKPGAREKKRHKTKAVESAAA